jgi:hypothetical protein
MRASAHSDIRPFAYDDYGGLDPADRLGSEEFLPADRIGPPLRRRGRRTLWTIVLLLVAFGATWGIYGPPSTWPVQRWADYAGAKVSELASALERKMAQSNRPAPPPAVAQLPPIEEAKPIVSDRPFPSAPEPLPAVKAPPTDTAKAPVSPIITGSLPPAAADTEPLPPLPPPSVDRSDPYQVKAEAVGLHPGLSRVLLIRLSAADYRNAGIAIKRALAETPDGDVLLYPRERKGGLALFKVHFVRGAGPECRRYVVTITKDGWATTAFPMEKCGAQVARRHG